MVAALTVRRSAAAASRTCRGRRRRRWRLVQDAIAAVVAAGVAAVAAAAAVVAEGADAAASSGSTSTLAATLLARSKLSLAAGTECPSSLRLPPAPRNGGEESGEERELVAMGDRGTCVGGLTLRGAAAAAARLFDTANATAFDGPGGGAWLGTALALTAADGGGGANREVLLGEPRVASEGGGGGNDDDEVDACSTAGVVLVRSRAPLTLSATDGSGTKRVEVSSGVVAAVALLPSAEGGASCVYTATDRDGGGDTNDDSACFPADAFVWVYPSIAGAADDPPVATTMKDLRLGDIVAIGGGRTSRVVAFSHADPAAVTTMVTVTTAGEGRLTLSPGHLVYTATGDNVDCSFGGGSAKNSTRDTTCVTGWMLTPAAALTVGSTLRSPTGGPLPVTAVTLSHAVGLYNPHTAAADGDLLVGGVWASTWTTAVGVGLGRTLLAPVRWWAAVAGVVGGLGPHGWLRGGGGGVHRWLPLRMRTW